PSDLHARLQRLFIPPVTVAIKLQKPKRGGRILEPPPKARGNGARLCAEHQPQRHGEATRFGIIRRLWASALVAAGPSDTAALRWWFQDAPLKLDPKIFRSRGASWSGMLFRYETHDFENLSSPFYQHN